MGEKSPREHKISPIWKWDTIDYCSMYSRSSKKAGWQVIGEKIKEQGDGRILKF